MECHTPANITAKPLTCDNHPGCFALLIDGRIEPDDGKKFEEVVKKNDVKMAVIVLNSPGGTLIAGYAIGTLIREKGYATYVSGGATCGSTCAMIWMAGSPRQVEAKARSEIEAWEQSLNQARGAKLSRISKLSQIL